MLRPRCPPAQRRQSLVQGGAYSLTARNRREYDRMDGQMKSAKRLPMGGTRILLRRQPRAGPTRLGWRETMCMIPSVGKSDRAAREDIVLAQASLAVAAVLSGVGSVGCQRLQHVVCTMQGALHHLRLANYHDLWQSGIPAGKHGPGRATRLKSA